MPPKKIYLVRHGQTEFNSRGIVQGRGVNASLNDLGRDQAKKFFNAYKDEPFEKVYISSLKRTAESVAGFIDLGIPFEVREGLDEISWGIHEGEEASEQRNVYFREMVSAWNSGETDFKIEDGESPEDVAQRQAGVIRDILASPEELILICMHGRAMRILLCQLLNIPLSEMDRFEHANLGLYILDYDGDEIDVLVSNSTEHMNSLGENDKSSIL